MKNYEKPVILESESMSEGIYMASGAGADAATPDQSDAGASYSLNQTNMWDGNKQYDITLTNNGNTKVDSISVTLQVSGNVTSIGGNVSGTVSGSTATITSNNYGNGFEAGASATFYMLVTGTGDFSLK